ncbi:MAG: hypothetical protein IJO64_05595 [Clostridia bacterium]|nr:hypothetical protein [Clostridia bacterium]MBQ9848509.1 hypothetical protein [Clostridia bacterium]
MKKKFAIPALSIILVVACLLSSCSIFGEKTFTVDELSITMSGMFIESEQEGAEAFYLTTDIGVLVHKETFEELEDKDYVIADLTEADYAKLRMEANEIEAEIVEESGSVCYEYNFDSDGSSFRDLVVVKKGNNAFWVISFYCLEDSFESNKANFLKYASSVTFS